MQGNYPPLATGPKACIHGGMDRGDLQRLSKDELIDLVLRLQRPEKTSRTSSKPPSTDRKERRDKAKPGGAKPGHEGHSRALSKDFDRVVDHRPDRCPGCLASLSSDLPAEAVSEHETMDLPEIRPVVERHRRLSVRCPSCRTPVIAPVPPAAIGTPFGPRIHAVATYLKTFQALSYERLQGAFSDLFGLTISQGGLTISQGGLMNMLRRSQAAFVPARDAAVAALHRAKVVTSDETGVRTEGSNAFQWVFRSSEAVVHRAAAPSWCARRWMATGRRSGVPTALRRSRGMAWCTRPASPISPATSPSSTRRARTCCRRGFASG